jgi:hypothetical protein
METFTKGNGLMTKHMDMEFTFMLMGLNTKECGKKISKTDMERKLGLMEHVMKENIKMGKNPEKVYSNGLMDRNMMDFFKRIIFMEKVILLFAE